MEIRPCTVSVIQDDLVRPFKALSLNLVQYRVGCGMKSELIPLNGDPPIPITQEMTLIGRRNYCDIEVDHPSLSRRHCLVIRTDGLLVIRDLITTNGTKVNGQRVMWAALLPDDRLSLGRVKFRVYLGPDDVPSPSESRSTGTSAPREPLAVALPADREFVPSPGSDPDHPITGITPSLAPKPVDQAAAAPPQVHSLFDDDLDFLVD